MFPFSRQNDRIHNRFTFQSPNNWSRIWEACLLFYMSKSVIPRTMPFLLLLLSPSQRAGWEAGLPASLPSPSARLKQMAEGHEIKSKHRWVTNFPEGDKKTQTLNFNTRSSKECIITFWTSFFHISKCSSCYRYDDNKQGRCPPGRLDKQHRTTLQPNRCK